MSALTPKKTPSSLVLPIVLATKFIKLPGDKELNPESIRTVWNTAKAPDTIKKMKLAAKSFFESENETDVK